MPYTEKKQEFVKKLYERLSKHKQIIIVSLMNVGSAQIQDIRKILRAKKGELVIGKNVFSLNQTSIKKIIKWRIEGVEESSEYHDYFRNFGKGTPQLQKLSDLVEGKVGLIFSDTPVYELKPLIEANKVQTAAKVGVIAPIDVDIPVGNTGLDPSQISFFHALNISTKINKGQIEITKDYKVCEKGKPVTNSQSVLLRKLNIKPFEYGMQVLSVYDDGNVLTPEIVSLSPADILTKFISSASNITGLSLELGFVNSASAPHLIVNAFKNILALSLQTDYKIAELASLTAAPAKPAAGKDQPKAVVAAPKEEEKKEEEEDLGVGDIFGF